MSIIKGYTRNNVKARIAMNSSSESHIKVEMPAGAIRSIVLTLVWIEMGDWPRTGKPSLPLSKDAMKRLSNRLMLEWSQLVEHTCIPDGPAGWNAFAKTPITAFFSYNEIVSVRKALQAVLLELKDNPIEMSSVISSTRDEIAHLIEVLQQGRSAR